jgi:hypothetical protein
MPLLPLALVGMLMAPPRGEWTDLAGLARLRSGALAAGAGRAPAAPGPTLPEPELAEYAVESAARGTLVFLLPSGPRTVRALEVEPAPGTAEAWRQARLRLTWDGDYPAGAGVEQPLGLAFGRVSAGAGLGATRLVGEEGGAWVNRFPMPYRSQALLQIDTERPLAGRLRARTTRGAVPDAGFFRAAMWPAGTARPPAPPRGSGRGHLAGLLVVSEGGPLPERPTLIGTLVLDGRPVGPLASAAGLPLDVKGPAGPDRGVVGGRPGGPSAAYRWLTDEPMTYDRSVEVEVDDSGEPGDRAGPAARVVLFWYSDRLSWGPRPAPDRAVR